MLARLSRCLLSQTRKAIVLSMRVSSGQRKPTNGVVSTLLAPPCFVSAARERGGDQSVLKVTTTAVRDPPSPVRVCVCRGG